MQSTLLLLELAFGLVFFSDCAPPEKLARYTHEEKDFLVKEMKSRANLFNHKMWKAIAEAHENKVKDKAPGFSKVRSYKSLQKYAGRLIKKNDIPVPDTIKDLRGDKLNIPYSYEEEAFINRELLSLDGSIDDDDLWKQIQKRHDGKRVRGDDGFSVRRRAKGLRAHFVRYMIRNHLVDEAVKQRFPDFFKQIQESIEASNQSESYPNENTYPYTNEENEFLINMLEEHADTYSHDNTWKIVQEAHKNNLEANIPGFSTPRSSRALYQRFITIMQNPDIVVPDTVRQLYEEQMNNYYNAREREFINAELLTYYGGKLFSKTIWKDIKIEHDKKRLSGCPGFDNERTWKGLSSYFQKRMIPKDLVDEAVKRRFPGYFINKHDISVDERKRTYENDPGENASGVSDPEDDVWGTILEDLVQSQRNPVDSHGVDHTLFVDRSAGVENDFFEPHSPHELRTFDPIPPYDNPTIRFVGDI